MQRIVFPNIFRIAVALGFAPTAALAICDVEYVVQPSDDLFKIADEHYGDRSRWTLIYYRNQGELVGPSAVPGVTLYIPCPPEGEAPVDVVAIPSPEVKADINFLTGGGYAPFADQSLPGQGLVTELLGAAMEFAPSPVSHSVTWENDWSRHLAPMLDSKEFDMGFPWSKPDCTADPSHELCVKFHFSEPLLVVPTMLFVQVGSDMVFETDADIIGKTLCRPAVNHTHDLDGPDRRWLTDDKITLLELNTPADCLKLVAEGRADAAVLNLFVGAEALVAMQMRDQVEPLEKPLSEAGLHVIISKTHWRGTAHLYRVNAGLKNLHESGRFDEIMERHFEVFQEKIGE